MSWDWDGESHPSMPGSVDEATSCDSVRYAVI